MHSRGVAGDARPTIAIRQRRDRFDKAGPVIIQFRLPSASIEAIVFLRRCEDFVQRFNAIIYVNSKVRNGATTSAPEAHGCSNSASPLWDKTEYLLAGDDLQVYHGATSCFTSTLAFSAVT